MSKRFVLAAIGGFLAPFLLVGCNGGEDFSDADIGGPVIQPSPGSGSPLPDDVESVEIEFVDDRVLGLGYECRDGQSGTGYTGYVERNGKFEDEDEGDPVPEVVECGREARAVEFFLGDATGSDRFELGTVYLPQQGKRQRYQVAPTDIITSPARLKADKDGSDKEKRAFYMAALLQGLDNDGESENGVIDIPLAAHEAILDCCGDGEGEPTPVDSAEGLVYDTYADFENDWNDWFDEVNGSPDVAVGVPANDNGQVGKRLTHGLQRLRAGTYTLEATLYRRRVVEVDDSDDIDDFLAPLLIQVPVLVYPDGQGVVQGVGYVANITGSFRDFNESNSTLGAISSGSSLNNELEIGGTGPNDGWEMTGLFAENVDLELSGRFLGSNLYYDLDGALTRNSDYKTDFPQSDAYELDDSDRGFYRGEAFSEDVRQDGELLSGYKTGFVAADYKEERLPAGSAQETAPQFYELTPYKACSKPEGSNPGICEDLGGNEPGNNYRKTITDDDGNNAVDVAKEEPKPAVYPQASTAASQQSFNVEIRGGYVYTDLDRDCTATDEVGGQYKDEGGSGSEEYRVGFVTRTNEGGGEDNLEPSMNLIIHMTGPADLRDELPHYGLRTSARMNLAESDQPLYRTGDGNYGDGIRALWVDQAGPSGFAYEKFRRDNQPLTNAQERESITRVRGALEGRAIASGDSACSGP